MIRYFLLIIFICHTIGIFANSLTIEFPQFSNTVIGIAPNFYDESNQQNHAKEQATVIYSRLQNSYSFYELMIIDYYNQKKTKSFTTNIDSLYQNYDDLRLIYTLSLSGYNIFFYDRHDSQIPDIKELFIDKIETFPEVKIEKNAILVATTADALKLDDALDAAFDLALAEMTKTTNLTAVSILEANYYYAFHDVLVRAENLLSNLRLSKITIKQNTDKNYYYYTVRIELRKTT